MPIEIRELVIKVKVEESINKQSETIDINMIKKTIESTCRKEVKKQLDKLKER